MAFISINAETIEYLDTAIEQIKDGNASGRLDDNNNWGVQGEFKLSNPFVELSNSDHVRLNHMTNQIFQLSDPGIFTQFAAGNTRLWDADEHEYLRGQLELVACTLGLEPNEFMLDALLAKVCE